MTDWFIFTLRFSCAFQQHACMLTDIKEAKGHLFLTLLISRNNVMSSEAAVMPP